MIPTDTVILYLDSGRWSESEAPGARLHRAKSHSLRVALTLITVYFITLVPGYFQHFF
jgi:hypothetical protein